MISNNRLGASSPTPIFCPGECRRGQDRLAEDADHVERLAGQTRRVLDIDLAVVDRIEGLVDPEDIVGGIAIGVGRPDVAAQAAIQRQRVIVPHAGSRRGRHVDRGGRGRDLAHVRERGRDLEDVVRAVGQLRQGEPVEDGTDRRWR